MELIETFLDLVYQLIKVVLSFFVYLVFPIHGKPYENTEPFRNETEFNSERTQESERLRQLQVMVYI